MLIQQQALITPTVVMDDPATARPDRPVEDGIQLLQLYLPVC